jgi:hypothetical protein
LRLFEILRRGGLFNGVVESGINDGLRRARSILGLSFDLGSFGLLLSNFLGSLESLQMSESFLVELEEDNLSSHGNDDDEVDGAHTKTVMVLSGFFVLELGHLLLFGGISVSMSNFVLFMVRIQLGSPGLD